jgi:heme/copper-type cytochrome/quinol oxidase subunit 4
MDPVKLRMRYLVGFFLAAVLTAAALRHILHVHAGFAREEIRVGVLITVGIGIFLVIILFRWSRRRS